MKIFIELDSIDDAIEFTRWLNTRQKPKTPLDKAGLNVRTANCLKAEGFEYVEDAQSATDIRLKQIPNFGNKALLELRTWKPNDQGNGQAAPTGGAKEKAHD